MAKPNSPKTDSHRPTAQSTQAQPKKANKRSPNNSNADNINTYKEKPATKAQLHPRNVHNQSYDFAQLIAAYPDLKPLVRPNDYGDLSVDFHKPEAVLALNKALLAAFYQLPYWSIPQGSLCPPIPGRVDYVHYIADLLAKDCGGQLPMGQAFAMLDLGTGTSAIYALLAQATYGWRCVGTDIVPASLANGQDIVKNNAHLDGLIHFRLQENARHVLKGVLHGYERFSVCICNPPFHASAQEAAAGSLKKVRQLTGKRVQKAKLNFAGEHHELWCEGGEVAFVSQMIKESLQLTKACVWFTSLVSKKEHLPILYQALRDVKAVQVKTIDMQQGQKKSRILAWTFMDKATREHALKQDAQITQLSV